MEPELKPEPVMFFVHYPGIVGMWTYTTLPLEQLAQVEEAIWQARRKQLMEQIRERLD